MKLFETELEPGAQRRRDRNFVLMIIGLAVVGVGWTIALWLAVQVSTITYGATPEQQDLQDLASSLALLFFLVHIGLAVGSVVGWVRYRLKRVFIAGAYVFVCLFNFLVFMPLLDQLY